MGAVRSFSPTADRFPLGITRQPPSLAARGRHSLAIDEPALARLSFSVRGIPAPVVISPPAKASGE